MLFSNGAWRIEIGTLEGVGASLKSMIPFLCKKSGEAWTALRYLDDQITGNEFQDVMRAAVRRRNRERLGRRVNLPWTRTEGLARAAAYVSDFAGRKPTLRPDQEGQIVKEYLKSGLSQAKFAESVGISRDVLRGALLRQGRGSSSQM